MESVAFLNRVTRTRGYLGVCDTHAVLAFRGSDPVTLPNWITDVVSFNKYFGWYMDGPEVWPSRIDSIHAFKSDYAMGISEYGAGASLLHHEASPTSVVTTSRWHPEEWQNIVHETAYKAMAAKPDDLLCSWGNPIG